MDLESRYNGQAPGESNGCHVEFFDYAEPRPVLSAQEGRPIFETVTYIRFTFPGGRMVHHEPATDEHKAMYPHQWAAYSQQRTYIGEGTPLDAWPLLDAGRVAELKAAKVYTVDQLAGIKDGDLGILGMGGLELRTKARAYLDVANGVSAPIERLTTENMHLKDEMAALRAELESLRALAEQPKRKRKEEDVLQA